MADTSDIKKGIYIIFNDKVHKIVDCQHVKPGKGPSFVRTKLKNLENEKIIENTFTSGVKIDLVRIEHREYQYLYQEEEGFVFMNVEDCTQIHVSPEKIENPLILRDGMVVTLVFNSDKEEILSLQFSPHLIEEVVAVEPAVKGNTGTHATKKAILETGSTVNVPLFIGVGDKIKLSSDTLEYIERVR